LIEDKMAKESVMVICAHPDDEVIGVGGTISKYINEGKDVSVVRFSYGEKSHQWLKTRVTAEMRKKEAEAAKKVLGYEESLYLAIEEGKFVEQKEMIQKELKKIILKKRPKKIFTHNNLDPHGDHKAVRMNVLEVVDSIKIRPEVFMFDVWNVLDFRRIEHPQLYVDITDTFADKIAALKCFKSQVSSMLLLVGFVYAKAIGHGLTHHVRFAERFFKIR
jgi:LmbE family N-acetylglucosaminyl deacetylase